MSDFLHVSESFYSVQGEGQTMGIPAVFVRLSGCNLLCQSDSWVCDTIEVWRKGVKTAFEDVLTPDWIAKLQTRRTHLVITGGEPLLHQKTLLKFFNWIDDKLGFQPIIEIETNGTIMPEKDMFSWVDYWNVSPKLANSGETAIRRINHDAIQQLNTRRRTIFKFVVSSEADVQSMLLDYGSWVDAEKIVLMPAGDSQELLSKTRSVVLEACMKYQFKYCDRLHIVAWNQKTGV